MTAAKTLAWSLGKPLVGVDHVHAHLYSVVLGTNKPPPMPAVGLVVSGGHTALYRVGSWLDVERIGSTIDDAVGEAYDKVAAILGLGYPGGPAIDRLAADGVLFENAYAHSPQTLPSHTSILSGELPFEHGVRDNGGFYVPQELDTLAERAKAAGYRTGAFVASFVLDRRWGLDQGFDIYETPLRTGASPLESERLVVVART